MRTNRLDVAFLALGLTVLLFACVDAASVASPQGPEPRLRLVEGAFRMGDGQQVQVLHRTRPLAYDETASLVVGPEGGTISLPKAGLTVRIPEQALQTPTRITVVAPAGNLVGYRFASRGLRFEKPVTVSQDLRGTDASLLKLIFGTHLTAAHLDDGLRKIADDVQTSPLHALGNLGVGYFHLQYFPGYVVATG